MSGGSSAFRAPIKRHRANILIITTRGILRGDLRLESRELLSVRSLVYTRIWQI